MKAAVSVVGYEETTNAAYDVCDEGTSTYANCREDILELVDQRDQAGIINVYAAHELAGALSEMVGDRGVRGAVAHEWPVGLAMAGDYVKYSGS